MRAEKRELPAETAVLRHIGIYAYRAGFLQRYAEMSVSPLETIESLEQLRVLWHGYPIAVETAKQAPPPAWIRRKIWTGFALSLRPSERKNMTDLRHLSREEQNCLPMLPCWFKTTTKSLTMKC